MGYVRQVREYVYGMRNGQLRCISVGRKVHILLLIHGYVPILPFIYRHRTIADRILHMCLVPSRRLVKRDVSYEFMNRQMVWHAFTVSSLPKQHSHLSNKFSGPGIPSFPPSTPWRPVHPSPTLPPHVWRQYEHFFPYSIHSRCFIFFDKARRGATSITPEWKVLGSTTRPVCDLCRERILFPEPFRTGECIHLSDNCTKPQYGTEFLDFGTTSLPRLGSNV